MSDKPEWDKSVPGSHPAFTPPTEEEIETARRKLRAIFDSPARTYLNDDDRLVANAASNVEFYRANLVMAMAEHMDETIIAAQRCALAANLVTLGEFDEARRVISAGDVNLKVVDEVIGHIYALEQAINRDDAEECQCQRPRATIPHHNNPGVEVEIELPRRSVVGKVFSRRHGKVVEVWQCQVCGHANAHPNGPPENQVAMLQERKRAEAMAHRLGPGATITFADNLADHVLMKPKPQGGG